MFGKEPVEERRVPILESGHADVALERIVLAPQVLELEIDLFLDREDPIRQQPAQVEEVSFPLAERRGPWSAAGCRGALVPPARSVPDATGGDGIERSGQRAHRGEHSGATNADAGRDDRPRPCAGSSGPAQSPVTTSVPTIPYASWPGRWQMYR